MKRFITSGILRKMLVLATLTCGLVFVHLSDTTVAAKGNNCCSFCMPLWDYCEQHAVEYKSFLQCLELNGGPDCEVCNPGC
jgi:hypothetical protein